MDALQTEEECNIHWSLILQLLYNLQQSSVQQNLQQGCSIYIWTLTRMEDTWGPCLQGLSPLEIKVVPNPLEHRLRQELWEENLQHPQYVQVRPLKLASVEEGQTKRREQTIEENPH